MPAADPDHLLLRGESPAWRDKDARRQQIVSSGHRIVLNVGDQLSDFSDVPKKGTPAERERWRAENCSMFGTLWFLLPNSTYGSFDDALFDHDRSLSAEAKRNRRARFLDLRGAPGADPKTDPTANAHCP